MLGDNILTTFLYRLSGNLEVSILETAGPVQHLTGIAAHYEQQLFVCTLDILRYPILLNLLLYSFGVQTFG
jgi:hypothetical protein